MQATCKTILPPTPTHPRKLARIGVPGIPSHHFRSVVIPVAPRRSALTVVPLLAYDSEFDAEEGLDTIPVPPDDHERPTVRP